MAPVTRRRSSRAVTDAEYRRLARFRHALRQFLHFSEAAARRAGISPVQYQLLLFVRGTESADDPPTIAELADRLQVAHQSAVGLVDRSARAGLVVRRRDREDARKVRVGLTSRGAQVLLRLVRAHSPEFDRLWAALFRLRPA